MKKLVIIKPHDSSVCIDIISYDDNKTCGNDVVEAWQKKQTCYLLRGELRACSWSVAQAGNFVGAMIESKRA